VGHYKVLICSHEEDIEEELDEEQAGEDEEIEICGLL